MSTPVRFTIADLETLPDPLDDTRYELIDGERVVSGQRRWEHQLPSLALGAALQAWSRQARLGVANTAPGGTNERRDRELKRKLYAREGVDEYWVIDWQAQTFAVFRRADDELRLVQTLTNEDELTSPLLPGFSYPVRDLWESALN